MKAVVYREFAKSPFIEQVPDPTPPGRGVVIGVRATGLCRSDWHGWMGHDPDIRLPHVPGHEFAGVIEAVGPGVAKWRAGDRVTLPSVCGCGECPQCASGSIGAAAVVNASRVESFPGGSWTSLPPTIVIDTG